MHKLHGRSRGGYAAMPRDVRVRARVPEVSTELELNTIAAQSQYRVN